MVSEATEIECFDADHESEIEGILKRYPNPRAALIPVLWSCQRRWGWLPPTVMASVGRRLGLTSAEVEGVVTFYTLFETRPRGRYLLQFCSTLSCRLAGDGGLGDHLKKHLDIEIGETTADGLFTLVEVQCLGACGEGPVLQVNDDYHCRMTLAEADALITDLRMRAS